MNILLFKGESQYDVLRFFVDELKNGFETLGHQVYVVDLLKDNFHLSLTEAISYKCHFAAGFNAVGYALEMNDISFYDACNIPFIEILVDHPIYHLPRLKYNIEKSLITCVDRTHVDFLNHYFKGRKRCAFLPHGGSIAKTITKDFSDRKYDVVFGGTYINPNNIKEQLNTAVGNHRNLFDHIIDYIIVNGNKPIYEAFRHVFNEYGLVLDIYESGYIYAMQLVDKYIRAVRRDNCLRMLVDNGIIVNCYGSNWENFNVSNKKNLIFNKQISYTYMNYIMQKSNIILNILPFFPDGSHERVFSSMLNGAVCLTDHNKYLGEEFINNKELVFYNWSNLDNLPNQIDYLLEHKDILYKIAQAGQKKACNNHTWVHRAKDLLGLVEKHFSIKE